MLMTSCSGLLPRSDIGGGKCTPGGVPPVMQCTQRNKPVPFIRIPNINLAQDDLSIHPSTYLISPTSLAKPHATDHLTADFCSYNPNPDVAIVVESWLKKHHTDAWVHFSNYVLFHRDRAKRRVVHGMAAFCRHCLNTVIFQPQTVYTQETELLWISVAIIDQTYLIGALYHPPRPKFSTDHLITSINSTLDEIHSL